MSKYIAESSRTFTERVRETLKNFGLPRLIIAAFLLLMFIKFFNPFIIFVAVVGSIIIFSIANSKYSKIYKEQVITSIINSYDKELRYNPTSGITRDVYRTAKFEYFDRYHTEDLIVGKIQGYEFALADVHTEKESTDSDGNTTYTTIFRGPVAVLELNIPCFLPQKIFPGTLSNTTINPLPISHIFFLNE